jgi:NOL1/NOP2/fmu family ribosome biogenesis protein
VLVDAPCSGESMFCKSEAARREWSSAAVAGCARRQADLLRIAANLVRPGGLLLYSTCTFSPEENEGTVAGFLRADRRFEVEALTQVPGAGPGRPEWLESEPGPRALARTVRLWPHRVPGAGHYLAGLRRRDDAPPGREPPSARTALPSEARRMVDTFVRESLRLELDTTRLTVRGQEVFAVPEGMPDTGGLRVLRPGWPLGSVLKNRFEPAHALGMALTPGEAGDAVLLAAGDSRVHAFLRGETIEAEGPPGWTLVTVHGFPLGWGKRVGRIVKNHLPKGLRWN